MHRFRVYFLALFSLLALASGRQALAHGKHPQQETGFLNRRLQLHGVNYRFQVYLPEEWRDDGRQWPVILYLHGRNERGSEGMWQTQVGLPQAVRDHPERWPAVIVMPQCPFGKFWTDPEMLNMALAALDQESDEFHTDPERTYLAGVSMGGYGAWELARMAPKRWAAMTIASSGIFWSYAPDRWKQASFLPQEYARAIGSLPIWLFHGSEDATVPERESELMYDAFKAAGGRLRLWIYQGKGHDCWTRAFSEPELPRWLLAHRQGVRVEGAPQTERAVYPVHPAAIKLSAAQLDAFAGEYRDPAGRFFMSVFRKGDRLYQKSMQGQIDEIEPETPNIFFYPNLPAVFSRIVFERDAQGAVVGALYHDERHDERWERRPAGR
jgi:acetyl esterase/lipase